MACAPTSGPVQPMIVAVSGGATRAGLWGAAVLDRVLQAQQQNGPVLFAVSSVSGGSLGTAGAMTLLSLESLACRAKGLPLLRARGDSPVPLAGDALGSLLGGWLLDDIPRAELGARVLGARHDLAVALDRDGAVREPQYFDQAADGGSARNLVWLAIDRDLHRGPFLLWGVGQVKLTGKRLAQPDAGR